MRKCRCRKSACALWVILIILFALMSTTNLIFELNKPSYMNYIGNIGVESKLWALTGAIIIYSVIAYMIYEFYKSAIPRIIFDENRAIFILSKNDKREFAWIDMHSPEIKIEWKRVRFQANFLRFTFPRDMENCSKFEKFLKDFGMLKSNKELLLAKNFLGYMEFEQLLIETGVLRHFNMEDSEKQTIYPK